MRTLNVHQLRRDQYRLTLGTGLELGNSKDVQRYLKEHKPTQVKFFNCDEKTVCKFTKDFV